MRKNYFSSYEFWKRKLGENFLEEYYEKTYTLDSDVSRDGIDEIIEVHTGNGGAIWNGQEAKGKFFCRC